MGGEEIRMYGWAVINPFYWNGTYALPKASIITPYPEYLNWVIGLEQKG